VLKRSVNATVNTKYKYDTPSRRPSKPNKRMVNLVADATHKLYRFTDVQNLKLLCPNGSCGWHQLSVGNHAVLGDFMKRMSNNFFAYNEQDPNSGMPDRQMLKYHIDSMSKNYIWMNSGNNRIHVEIYECIPRAVIFGGSNNTPFSYMETQSHTGNLFDMETVASETPQQMGYQDVRYTPFMCPQLCHKYKIINVRKFECHAGGRFDIKLDINNFHITHFDDIDDTLNVYAKPGKYKVLLLKIYGELGLVTTASSSFIRHTGASIIGQENSVFTGRAGADHRIVYQDIAISKIETVSAPINQTIVNEESATDDNLVLLQPAVLD